MANLERTTTPITSSTMPQAKTTARKNSSPLRHRPLGRASTFAAESSHPLRPRRSSNFSDSIDSAKQSIKSSTDDILLPRARSPDMVTNHEPSHWHSAPLALALFPALGGLFFHNGSVVVTDLTLLILAAVFLNWAVRLPWDWYLSAQCIRVEDLDILQDDYSSDTIIEEGSEDEAQAGQPQSTSAEEQQHPPKAKEQNTRQVSATSELRMHELLALAACFICPAVGAWLLHNIRGQLSRPSEGLVSNYNLTIFLLASELRPVSHLIRLVQARTLHLQRTIAFNPQLHPNNSISPSTIQDLQTRLKELETHVADTTLNGSPTKSPTPDLMMQVRKSLQPDLDALNRAVRRYEKRMTVLSIQTDSRLQELEKRMTDAITLAAAAERSTQAGRQRKGLTFFWVIDWAATMALLPLQVTWSAITIPGRVIGSVMSQLEGYVGQKIRREMKTAGRGEGRIGSGNEKRRVQGRGQKKVS